jgi:hypothetical protein
MANVTGSGDFVDDMRYPSTWNPEEAEIQWDVIKQQAKNAGMSVLEWLGETAFKGSQNPQGILQQGLGAVSYPFRKTAEAAMDYVLPMEGPDTWFQSENLPPWLSKLNDPRIREFMLSKGYGTVPITAAMMGGLGIPVNKWAEGEDVTKGDLVMGGATLAGPVVAGTVKGTTKLGAKLAPKTAGRIEENVDAARRRFIQGMGAGAGLISAGAIGTKGLVGKVVAPVAKVTAAATKISTITTGLAGKVFRSLDTLIKQTPSGGYPKQAVSRTGDTILPSPAMADNVGNTISSRMGTDLLRPENRNILRFVNRIYAKSDYADEMFPPEVTWKNLDEIEGVYKSVDDIVVAEEKNLHRIYNDPLPGQRIHIGSAAQTADDAAYVNYHTVKNSDLSMELIRFEQSLSTIDNLAKTDSAKLIRILDEMIEEANVNINRVRKIADEGSTGSPRIKPGHTIKDNESYYLINADGKPVMVNIGEQRSTITMAREMLDALQPTPVL